MEEVLYLTNLEITIAKDTLDPELHEDFVDKLVDRIEEVYPNANPKIRFANRMNDEILFKLNAPDDADNLEYANFHAEEEGNIKTMIENAYLSAISNYKAF